MRRWIRLPLEGFHVKVPPGAGRTQPPTLPHGPELGTPGQIVSRTAAPSGAARRCPAHPLPLWPAGARRGPPPPLPSRLLAFLQARLADSAYWTMRSSPWSIPGVRRLWLILAAGSQVHGAAVSTLWKAAAHLENPS